MIARRILSCWVLSKCSIWRSNISRGISGFAMDMCYSITCLYLRLFKIQIGRLIY